MDPWREMDGSSRPERRPSGALFMSARGRARGQRIFVGLNSSPAAVAGQCYDEDGDGPQACAQVRILCG